ncbi:MAG: glycosyltransferase family 39 protein [Deltaproteobacteria bacterium]|nr:glycosyltransferase family 39 protein [Deltaproteobacteria bacterium]
MNLTESFRTSPDTESSSLDTGIRMGNPGAGVRFFRTKAFAVILIVCLGFSLRLRTGLLFPLSYDEYHYLSAANNYAYWIYQGRIDRVLTAKQNYMHPPLVKYIFAAAILLTNSKGDFENNRLVVRMLSVLAGTACVAVLAWMCPMAGLALAVHNIGVKFNGLAYLDSFPMLFSFLAVLACEKAGARTGKWFYGSAVLLAATAASKLPFVIVGVPIVYFTWISHRPRTRSLLKYGLTFFLAFALLNPVWWFRTGTEVVATVLFHYDYSRSEYVSHFGLPWYQPLKYLFMTRTVATEPRQLLQLDPYVFLASLLGLGLLWKQRPIYLCWYATAMSFLFIWPTKWTHYPMILLVPLCLSCGLAVEWTARRWGFFTKSLAQRWPIKMKAP